MDDTNIDKMNIDELNELSKKVTEKKKEISETKKKEDYADQKKKEFMGIFDKIWDEKHKDAEYDPIRDDAENFEDDIWSWFLDGPGYDNIDLAQHLENVLKEWRERRDDSHKAYNAFVDCIETMIARLKNKELSAI